MSRTFYSFIFALLMAGPVVKAQEVTPPSKSCRFQDDLGECKDAFAFFHKLRSAVSANQVQVVAGMVDYPLSVTADGKSLRITTPRAFLAHYDEIINPAERCAITTVKDTDVWSNSHGYTIDRGAVWWEKVLAKQDEEKAQAIDWSKVPFKLLTINNVNVMTQPCMKLNMVQTISSQGGSMGKGIVVDFREVEVFFSQFQKFVANDDQEKIADMVLYPLKVRIGGKHMAAQDKTRFLQLYDSVFKKTMKDILLKEDTTGMTTWWEGIVDAKSLVQFAPVSGTKNFLFTELADSPPKPATIK